MFKVKGTVDSQGIQDLNLQSVRILICYFSSGSKKQSPEREIRAFFGSLLLPPPFDLLPLLQYQNKVCATLGYGFKVNLAALIIVNVLQTDFCM